MPDYDFSGLSTRSFEQLVQSLASELFGGRLIQFGDGPDGGREAIFEGRVDFPRPDHGWDGYGVVQAKFKQRPQGAPNDGRWFIDQLRDELKAYEAKNSRRRRPEYFLVATNVALTAGSGGDRDKVDDLLKQHSEALGIKEYCVWEYGDVRAYLDRFDSLRKAYTAFITAGDVLAAAMETLGHLGAPSFEDTIANFLQKELLSDQFARLEQAGHSSDDRIPIARVFIDLPARDNEEEEELGNDGPPFGVVDQIMDTAHLRLNPSSQQAKEQLGSGRESRLVVVGGPGQGKTTIGQYACQLLRASILRDRPEHQLMPEARATCAAIEAYCDKEELNLPRARRFPVRVVLSEFAEALARGGDPSPSLFAYICSRVATRADSDVPVATFREWLSSYPWLLVLDGLDEVPGTSNRNQLMDAVRDFLVDVQQLDADVLVVATTRPQGYSAEFDPKRFRHVWLSPLDTDLALAYAGRLVASRYPNDDERQARIMSRLERASAEDATARLMESPLQVTIMATLVDQFGQPPQERWNLFRQYYEVIYRREMERDIPVSGLLRSHRPNIDAIHRHVALLLHMSSENEGSTESRMPSSRFEEIVRSRLASEGYSGDELEDLTTQVMRASTDRLVFLVGVEADRVGFEIRSLQEFMAAEGLTDGSDSAVIARMTEIAALPHWRNTTLFAAGRIFVDKQHLRDHVHTVCAALNEESDVAVSRSLAGARLAMDLLEDGSPIQQPKWAVLLARQALRILDSPPSANHVRLALLYKDLLRDVYLEELERRLAQQPLSRQLGSWLCTVALAEVSDVFEDLLARHWPSDAKSLREIALATTEHMDSWKLYERFVDILPQLSSDDFSYGRIRRLQPAPPQVVPDWFATSLFLLGPHNRSDSRSASLRAETARFQLSYIPLDDRALGPLSALSGIPEDATGWSTLRSIGLFALDPNRETLARELENLAEHEAGGRLGAGYLAPWPLASCLLHAGNSEGLLNLSNRARQGALGDRTDWEEAESRWTAKGVTSDEIKGMTDDELPFSAEIATDGFPITQNSLVISSNAQDVEQMLALVKSVGSANLRGCFAGWALRCITFGRAEMSKGLSDEDLIMLLRACSRRTYTPLTQRILHRLVSADLPEADVVQLLDNIGRDSDVIVRFRDEPGPSETYLEYWRKYPLAWGLLPILASLVEGGVRLPYVDELPELADVDDYQVRSAALVLRISNLESRPTEAEELADTLVATQSEYEFRRPLNLLARVSDPVLHSRVLDRMFKFTPESDWSRRALIVNEFETALSQRTSSLGRASVWEQLDLPGYLLPLVPPIAHTS